MIATTTDRYRVFAEDRGFALRVVAHLRDHELAAPVLHAIPRMPEFTDAR